MKSRKDCYDNAIWVPRGKIKNWFIYVAAFIVRPVVKLLFRYKVHGLENVKALGDENVIYACNHVSFWDPVILWCVLYSHAHGSRFLARRSLFRPVVGDLIARAGAIPVEPDSADKEAVKRGAASLKRGENLLIFPEGTRMNTPEKQYHPHAGVVLIANMGKAKIVPVGIQGTDRIMPYGKLKIPRLPRAYVKFGEPIDPKGQRYQEVPKKERTELILNDVMDSVFELRDSAREE